MMQKKEEKGELKMSRDLPITCVQKRRDHQGFYNAVYTSLVFEAFEGPVCPCGLKSGLPN